MNDHINIEINLIERAIYSGEQLYLTFINLGAAFHVTKREMV